MLMIAGIALVGFVYYFDDVELPEDFESKLLQSTEVTYADGSPMARLGDQKRTVVTIDKISKDAQHAVVAAEDKSFYRNDGVDYQGTIRALVNNVMGRERQGGSTITQQYARDIANLNGISYGRKLREAVLAIKLKQKYTDDKILEMYLNTVNFGRSAYGIEAAAQAFFNKSAKDLTKAEGMVLAGVIKQPNGMDGGGSPYDPTVNKESAQARFDYIKGNMVESKYMSESEAATLKYPENVVPYDPKNTKLRAQWGVDTPEGNIVHQVMDEISKINKPGTSEKRFTKIRNSGLKIVTTIDKDMQAAARVAAASDGEFFKSLKLRESDKLQAALVAVEPGTGNVKAYYGGPTGVGIDYAGIYQDPVLSDGEWTLHGLHPPGSTMKIYTLAAGLMDDYTIDSTWDGSGKVDFAEFGRPVNTNPVQNAGAENANCKSGTPKACTLWESTYFSLNTPFFALTTKVGVRKVIEVARAAGIRYMKAGAENNGKLVDLSTLDVKSENAVRKYFNYEVGFGQYAITPLDHATGVASIAARGWSAKRHFIDKIYKNDEIVYDGAGGAKQIPGLTQAMTDNMSWVMQKIVKDEYKLSIPKRESAGKSGTWQRADSGSENAHAWFVGYTARDSSKKINGLASAVWLGSKGAEQALKFQNGANIYGGRGAGPIWQKFMTLAMAKQPVVTFSDRKDTGTKDVGNGESPSARKPEDRDRPDQERSDQPGQGHSPHPWPGDQYSPSPQPSRRD